MLIDDKVLDNLTRRAQNSPRLRCNLYPRNSEDDNSHAFKFRC